MPNSSSGIWGIGGVNLEPELRKKDNLLLFVVISQANVQADISRPEYPPFSLRFRRTRRRWRLLQYPRLGDSQICRTARYVHDTSCTI